MAGVSRNAATRFSLDLDEKDLRKEVRDYLAEMEVSRKLAKELPRNRRGKEDTLSADDFAELVSERPSSHTDWLNEHCGSISEQEREDYRRLQAASFLASLEAMQAQQPQRKDLASLIEKYQAAAGDVSELSSAYRAQLQIQWDNMRACTREALADSQQAVIKTL